MSCKEGTGSLRAIDEIEPTICHLSKCAVAKLGHFGLCVL